MQDSVLAGLHSEDGRSGECRQEKENGALLSENKEATLRYSNGVVTVLWKPHVCAHSGICVRGLPSVFDASRRPWIDPLGASTDEIVAQVEKCPSGAISIEWESIDGDA